MLSKNTKPGTQVVGLRDPGAATYIAPEYIPQTMELEWQDHEGHIFVVEQIIKCSQAKCGYGVVLQGFTGVWPLEAYHPLELPECWVSLLTGRPLEVA